MSERAASSDFWDTAKTLINTLYSVFGQPQELAARGAVDRKTYVWFIAWLQACETLLRRLLLLEAKTLNVPPSSSQQTTAAGKVPAIRIRSPFSLNPDDWRVSFRLLGRRQKYGPPAPRRHALALAGEAPAVQTHPAWPLALRAEALYRVAKNPLPYARRLARMLARIPATLVRILAPPHTRKRKSGDPPNPIDIIGPNTWADLNARLPNTS